jgi:hypothetical protein
MTPAAGGGHPLGMKLWLGRSSVDAGYLIGAVSP